MSSKSMMPKLAISALCLALLSACGGDDGPAFSSENKSGFLPVPENKFHVSNRAPSVDKMFTEGAPVEGQQLSPTVAIVKSDANKLRFNQPGVVSEFSNPEGENQIVIKLKQQVDDLKNNQKEAESKLDNLRKQSNPSKEKLTEQKNIVDNLKKELATAEEELSVAKARAAKIITMLDINKARHNIYHFNTIDQVKNLATIPSGLRQDAGITKIDKIRVRDKNGSISLENNYGGSIGREFNELILFSKDDTLDPKYLNLYIRSPAMAGWSYQTFGSFYDTGLAQHRDLVLGYQNFGSQTQELPKGGTAKYEGISVAHYDGQQVTMHNEINANFGKRNLSYKTTGKTYYHTFEGPKKDLHVIEERPELSLTGSASWKKGTNDFQGNISSGNGLQGTLKGRFYGPKAEEIGGVFGLEGQVNGKEVQYVGGFGGKISE